MDKELLKRTQELWETEKKIDKFGEKFNYNYPQSETTRVYEGMCRLIEELPDRPDPASKEELYEAELKRILSSKALSLDIFIMGKPYTLENIIAKYCIEREDIDGIYPWLIANKGKTIESIDRLFHGSEIESFELQLPTDIPRIRQQAEGFAASQITNYHQKFGGLIEEMTSAGAYLPRITAEPTHNERSYYHPLTRRLALDISTICFEQEDGTIQLRERQLIKLYGHEGMGHALHGVITQSSSLPFFLKDLSDPTMAAEESITQHYEKVIFEDVKNSKKIQKELRILDNFDELYQEELDTRQIDEYSANLYRFAITVLADKSLGHHQDPETLRNRMQKIAEVQINPTTARRFVNQHRHDYDDEGNLRTDLVGELRYGSKTVDRALEIFRDHNVDYTKRDERSLIDMTFLTGYFTPIGYLQIAELAAREYASR